MHAGDDGTSKWEGEILSSPMIHGQRAKKKPMSRLDGVALSIPGLARASAGLLYLRRHRAVKPADQKKHYEQLF